MNLTPYFTLCALPPELVDLKRQKLEPNIGKRQTPRRVIVRQATASLATINRDSQQMRPEEACRVFAIMNNPGWAVRQYPVDVPR
jgi:hypothetical protein